MATTDHDSIVEQRSRVLREIAGIGDLRQGSLTPHYRRCGKPNCRCAGEGGHKHGPYWYLTWSDRKTKKSRGRAIAADAVEGTRAQIAEYRRLRDLMHELIDISARICDARLDAGKASEKRGAFTQRSRRKSTPKRASPGADPRRSLPPSVR